MSHHERNGNRNGASPHVLRLPALEVAQGPKRTLYSFAVDGKLLSQFTTVSRVRRGAQSAIEGYQRPEVLAHIAEIRAYLESENPMIPNAVVVAFDRRACFEAAEGLTGSEHARMGTLVIPVDPALPEEERPGWVVDGQQRIAAIRDAAIDRFPVCVVAFITDDDQEQREQFILVNSTKPLPKGLIYELLPTTRAKLPSLLQHRRFPAHLLNRLNHDEGSPLRGLIRTPTVVEGLIKDNSVLKMLENSLSDGVLYRFRDARDGGGDTETMLGVLNAFWTAVSEVFEDAWKMPPRRSRLMHGAGIVSVGFVMDAIADRYRQTGLPTVEQFRQDLQPLREVCRWTDGYWDFGPGDQRKWNEIQNTHRDIQILANYLLVQYKALVWNQPQRP
jgi:DGQHR domain-containing protein